MKAIHILILAICAGCNSAPSTQRLVVHEWGTYTSAQSSAGETLDGMHHQEEALPDFVHSRQQFATDVTIPDSKGIESLPEPINQKLETPVLYFYTDEPMSLRVSVDFPDGIISEWYPKSTRFAPQVGDMLRIENGSMTWDVELSPFGPARIAGRELTIPAVSADSIWAPSRAVDSAFVRVGLEQDKFIFYRGLGMFDMPVQTRTSDSGVEITNNGDVELPAVFVLNVHEGGASIVSLGALRPGQTVFGAITPKELTLTDYIDVATSSVRDALVSSGLTFDEATAMVTTWEQSYFRTYGVRVLYVAPRQWTDALLPLQLDPAPDELVRTLVGRIEVFTPSAEAEVVDMVVAHMNQPGSTFDFSALGRLAEPKLRRALQLVEDDGVRLHCQDLVRQAVLLP